MSMFIKAAPVAGTISAPKRLFTEILSGGGGAAASYIISENEKSVASIMAVAAGSRPLTYSIAGGADAAKFTLNSKTGQLNFVNAQNFEKPTDVGQNNIYDVRVKASDGVSSDTQSISVAVKNVNEAPVITSNGAGSNASIQVAENTKYVTTVVAQDPDSGAKLVHSIAGGADAAKFTINSATGVLKFIAAPDHETPTDKGGNQVYDVIVKSSDGVKSDTQAIAVKVTDVNENSATPSPPSPVGGTVTVANAAELLFALKHAHGGETILLKAGDYGSLHLNSASGIPAYSSQVTIKSADPSHAAVFHNVNFKNVNNVKFDSVVFDYKATAGASLSETPFKFINSSGITVTNSQISGDLAKGLSAVDDGYGTGKGLVFLGGKNIEVSNNTITDFFRGATFGNVTGLKVVGNDVSKISSDGFDFTTVNNALIDSNHIHDFNRNIGSAAHADMIQFWTTNTISPTTNVVITNNFLDMGGGTSTQSIFMRNEVVDQGLAGKEMFYKNITIANNLIANLHNHGISIGATDGLIIDNNTLIQKVSQLESKGAAAPSIGISIESVNVKLTDNVTPVSGGIFTKHPDAWQVSNNITVQSTTPQGENYAGNVYADFLDRTSSSLADYHVVPGSILSGGSAGSSLGLISKAPGLTGFLHTENVGHGAVLAQSFDATNIFASGVKINTTGAKVVWDFGDHTVGSGLNTQHVYSKPGVYEAKATITLASNQVIVVDKTLTVVSDHLLSLDFNHSVADRSLSGNDFLASKVTFAPGQDGQAIRLNGGYVKYSADANFFGNSEFSVLADFKKDAGTVTKGGYLLYFSKMLYVSVGNEGVQVNISTTNGPVVLSAPKAGLANADWHKLAVTFSGEQGTASLYVDGKLAASVAVKIGSTQLDVINADFLIGSPAGGSFVGMVDNVHYIGDALTALDIKVAHPVASWEAFSAAATLANQASVDTLMAMHSPIAASILPDDFSLF